MGGFLNPYDFAYGGRDTVNQATKVAQEVIKNVGNERINIAKESISQIITQGGKESERVLPKILRGVIEDVYQTPFRLLENLGKQINKIYICFIYCIFYSFSGRKGPSRFFFNPSIFSFSLYAIDSFWKTLQVSPVYQSLPLLWNSSSRKQTIAHKCSQSIF